MAGFEQRYGMRFLLTLLPMMLATLGGAVDEHTRRGLTLWREACRSAGLTASSLLVFTLELLPLAVIGGLLGGLAVLAMGWAGRATHCTLQASLAAHLGCVIAMIAGMVLCTWFLPPAWMLVVEPLLAVGLAGWLGASVAPRTRALPSA